MKKYFATDKFNLAGRNEEGAKRENFSFRILKMLMKFRDLWNETIGAYLSRVLY